MSADYKKNATAARLKTLEMIFKAQVSHIASNFSVTDIAAVLYEHTDLSRDRILWSKGWAAATAYYFLAEKGIIPKEDLETFCTGDSKYVGLVEPAVTGIDFAGGSMGMGFPAGIGFALAKKLKHEEGRVFVIMSDGEQDIGTTWEAAMIGTHHKLYNLTVIIDYNKFQAMGKTNEILNIEPLADKWKAFGWRVVEIDGHNYAEIEKALRQGHSAELSRSPQDKPTVIIAHTIKGKGWRRAESNNLYHYKKISPDEFEEAKNEILNHG